MKPKHIVFRVLSATMVLVRLSSALAGTIGVPGDHSSLQTAINAANGGDTVLVAAGTYHESIVMKPFVTLKSAGDDKAGKLGLLRAERTIIQPKSAEEGQPGVTMANGAVLDGFTITGVGHYDDAKWKKHHATQGNEQNHDHIGAPGIGGIAIGVSCTVRNNIVHHIGYTGIAVRTTGGTNGTTCSPSVSGNICYRNMGGGIGIMNGARGRIEKNVCFENFYAGIGHENASPTLLHNVCYENIRAGIGISEGSCPVVKHNECYRNRRAGIGIRSLATTRPVVEDNDCFDNNMAGIGVEEHAAPLITGNRCYQNHLAGIGSREHAHPTIRENECYRNGTVGIGQDSNSQTILIGNYCHDNKAAGIGFAECDQGTSKLTRNRVVNNGTVAIGIQSGWKIIATQNELSCEGGMPPLVMIFKGSEAIFRGNQLEGSGVAGIRVAGKLSASRNTFTRTGKPRIVPRAFAIWALKDAEVDLLEGNRFTGWAGNLRAD